MITQKATIKIESAFSEDSTHRFYLKKTWDNKKKSALVIMLSVGDCNGITMDYNTLFSINNLVKLGYASIEIVNLFTNTSSAITSDFLKDTDAITKNNEILVSKSKSADTIIIAWGRAGRTNKSVSKRETQVLSLLKEFEDKTYVLCDLTGRRNFHPLSPQCRHNWNLQPLENTSTTQEGDYHV